MISSKKLNNHDCKMAVEITRLWKNHLRPNMTQTDFATKFGFTQTFMSQVLNFHSAATHSFICAMAKELSCQPIDIDPLFNEPDRFRK